MSRRWSEGDLLELDLALADALPATTALSIARALSPQLGRTVRSLQFALSLRPGVRWLTGAPRPWTTSELRAVDAALAAGTPTADIARQVSAQTGRTLRAVREVILDRDRLRAVRRSVAHRGWTEEEIEAVLEGRAARVSYAQIAAKTGRTAAAVRAMAASLGLARKRRRPLRRWTREEIVALREMLAGGMSHVEAAQALGRTDRGAASALLRHAGDR